LKRFENITQQAVIKLTCDDCGLESNACEDYEFGEFISVNHRCGYGSIHGDSVQLAIDCQHNQCKPLDTDKQLNLKKAFAKTHKVKPRVGMKRAMQLTGLSIDDRAHCALGDAKNISKLLLFIFGLENIKRENFSVKST
jgi:hypothetical protein